MLLQDSPEVLNAPRKKALQDFVAQGIPSRKNENYKYSNLQPQFMPEYKFIHHKEEVKPILMQCFVVMFPNLIHISNLYLMAGFISRIAKTDSFRRELYWIVLKQWQSKIRNF